MLVHVVTNYNVRGPRKILNGTVYNLINIDAHTSEWDEAHKSACDPESHFFTRFCNLENY